MDVRLVTPSEIVNRCSLRNNAIVNSYIKLGYVHVLPQEQHHAMTRLLMFAGGQMLKSKVQKIPRQKRKSSDSFMVDSTFDNTFEGWFNSRKQQCTATLNH